MGKLFRISTKICQFDKLKKVFGLSHLKWHYRLFIFDKIHSPEIILLYGIGIFIFGPEVTLFLILFFQTKIQTSNFCDQLLKKNNLSFIINLTL